MVNNIQTRLTRCFSAVFPNLSEQQITNASLETIDGWDSIAAATLVTAIEEEFEIEFAFEVLGDLTSYPVIFDYLSAHPSGK
jgi:acyl carrier protein